MCQKLIFITLLLVATATARINIFRAALEPQESDPAMFVVGFVEGFINEKADALEGCGGSAKDLTGSITKAMKGFKEKSIIGITTGLESLVEAALAIPEEFATRTEAESAIAAFKKKMKRFNDPSALAMKIGMHALLHKQSMLKEANKSVELYNNGEMKKSGLKIGKLLDQITK